MANQEHVDSFSFLFRCSLLILYVLTHILVYTIQQSSTGHLLMELIVS